MEMLDEKTGVVNSGEPLNQTPVVAPPPVVPPPATLETSTVPLPGNKIQGKGWLGKKIFGGVVLFLGIIAAVYFLFPKGSPQGGTTQITNTPVPVTTSPTLLPKLTAVTTPPFSNTRSWLIRLDAVFFSASQLPSGGEKDRKDVTATLYSPLNEGDYLCRYEAWESVFLEKKTPNGFVRLCDKSLPVDKTHQLRCEPYKPSDGVQIYATFYPADSCTAPTSTVSPGDYRMHARVYTDCKVDAATGIGTKCKGIVDAVSPQFQVSK